MLARLNADLDSRTGPRSKPTPDLEPSENKADRIEKLLLRTDSAPGAWWYTDAYTEATYNGLDLFDSYAPTVLEDEDFDWQLSRPFAAILNDWVVAASEREQGIPRKEAQNAKSPRYNFCIMVDEEALRPVLSIPAPDDPVPGRPMLNKTTYVILANRKWPQYLAEFEDEKLAEISDEDNSQEPIEGCTLEDVGWMKLR
ncbi:hypothetical protein BDW66DRAFT_155730 [Aspergillus desertorum]